MTTGNLGGVQTAGNTSGNAQQVANMTQSSRGPLAVPISPDWTVQTSYLVDLSIQNSFGTIDMVQTLFIDNSLSTVPFYAINAVSQQTIVCPAGAQGYFPFLCPQPSRFTIASTGGVRAYIEALNFPVQPAVWNAGQQAFKFDGNGNLLTSDATLSQVAVAGAALNVNSAGGGSSASTFANVSKPIYMAGAGIQFDPTNPPTGFAAGTHFILHSAQLTIPPGTYVPGGTDKYVNISMGEQGLAACLNFELWVPGAAPALTGLTPPIVITYSDIDFISAGLNNQLRFFADAVLTDPSGNNVTMQTSVIAITP